MSYGSHVGVLIIEDDDDEDEDGTDRVLFIILVKSSFNLISGNKLKNLFQTNFIDNKKNSTRKSGQSSFFSPAYTFFVDVVVVNQKDTSKVNRKKYRACESGGDWRNAEKETNSQYQIYWAPL